MKACRVFLLSLLFALGSGFKSLAQAEAVENLLKYPSAQWMWVNWVSHSLFGKKSDWRRAVLEIIRIEHDLVLIEQSKTRRWVLYLKVRQLKARIQDLRHQIIKSAYIGIVNDQVTAEDLETVLRLLQRPFSEEEKQGYVDLAQFFSDDADKFSRIVLGFKCSVIASKK